MGVFSIKESRMKILLEDWNASGKRGTKEYFASISKYRDLAMEFLFIYTIISNNKDLVKTEKKKSNGYDKRILGALLVLKRVYLFGKNERISNKNLIIAWGLAFEKFYPSWREEHGKLPNTRELPYTYKKYFSLSPEEQNDDIRNKNSLHKNFESVDIDYLIKCISLCLEVYDKYDGYLELINDETKKYQTEFDEDKDRDDYYDFMYGDDEVRNDIEYSKDYTSDNLKFDLLDSDDKIKYAEFENISNEEENLIRQFGTAFTKNVESMGYDFSDQLDKDWKQKGIQQKWSGGDIDWLYHSYQTAWDGFANSHRIKILNKLHKLKIF